ncbi:MAG: uroporphyrinogen decarboxylase family protein [Bacilli bacterium]
MNKTKVLKQIRTDKKAIPILFFPTSQLMNVSVLDLVTNPLVQSLALQTIAQQFDVGALIGVMDLSVEAEAFGSAIKFTQNDFPNVTNRIATTMEEVNGLEVPKIGAKRTKVFLEAFKETSNHIKNKPLMAGVIGPFSLAGRLMGMTEIMMNCYDEPEMVHLLLEKTSTFILNYIRAFKEAGANGVLMAEPAAGLLSPTLCHEFSTNYVKTICQQVKDHDFIFIYHNCGNVFPLLGSILTIDADAYHFGEATNLKQVLENMPQDKLVLGNISPSQQFLKGTPKSIYDDTTKLLYNCRHFDQFILSSGCDIPPLAPINNIQSFFQALQDFKNKVDGK